MKKKFISFTIFLLLLFVLSVFLIGLNKNPLYDTKSLEGQRIKNFELEHFDKEKIIVKEDLLDSNFTLINFWASWCSPCKLEHPYLLKLKNNKNIKIIGVNFKDKQNNAIDFLESYGNPYDILTKDNSGKQSINFGIYGIPESILIDKNLVIIKKFIGPILSNDYKNIEIIINNE